MHFFPAPLNNKTTLLHPPAVFSAYHSLWEHNNMMDSFFGDALGDAQIVESIMQSRVDNVPIAYMLVAAHLYPPSAAYNLLHHLLGSEVDGLLPAICTSKYALDVMLGGSAGTVTAAQHIDVDYTPEGRVLLADEVTINVAKRHWRSHYAGLASPLSELPVSRMLRNAPRGMLLFADFECIDMLDLGSLRRLFSALIHFNDDRFKSFVGHGAVRDRALHGPHTNQSWYG